MIMLVSGPIIVEDKKVLLNISGDSPQWKTCGGKVEPQDADLFATCRREAKEEMNIELERLPADPFLFYATKQKTGEITDIVLIHFLAKSIGEITPGPDVREWKWVPINELDHYDLAPNIKPALKHFGYLEK